jgi:PIN domain nuclease of toxin-antitoxin system
MRCVVDTRPFLWWLTDPTRLTMPADSALQQASEISVSAMTMLDLQGITTAQEYQMIQDAIDEDPRYRIVAVGIGVLTVAHTYIIGLGPIQRAVLATALYTREPIVTDDQEIADFLKHDTEGLATTAIW